MQAQAQVLVQVLVLQDRVSFGFGRRLLDWVLFGFDCRGLSSLNSVFAKPEVVKVLAASLEVVLLPTTVSEDGFFL